MSPKEYNMSLKTFHVIFIVFSIAVSLIYAYWSIRQYQSVHVLSYLWSAIGSGIFALGLIVYEVLFLKKVGRS